MRFFDGLHSIKKRSKGYPNARKSGSVTLPALRFARVAFAKGAAVADEHQQGNFVQMCEGDDAVMDAKKPWFCISMADFTPAKYAPAETPTASSSFASRTRVISGSSSANRMRCTNQVSGQS